MQDLKPFRKKLEKLKSELTHRVTAIDKDIRHEGMSADWAEQASERENDEVLESLGNASSENLIRIKNALKRIESGEYFTCSLCGETIPAARMELLPFTTHCINCAEDLEH
ncbi:MAG: TraR/DksA family transcriptional regulator [Gammaproteobacteria bacterium]|nr:TraR/DksA family transcriptional regulator [Gammaproteobacteria bacterium]